MIMSTEKNKVLTNASDAETRNFTIACNENILDTLSRRLYTNIPRAVIRELVSNAIDANIEAGVDEKILLHLPSGLEPEFYVEDHGIGMNEETIYNVYTQYGNSTKNGSNNCIGGLGLGSKTPFAYTDQFFVISSKDGIKNTFVCFRNEQGEACITKMASEACSATGTKVSFPVKENDIRSFTNEAVITLLFTMKMPELVGEKDRFLRVAGVESLEEYEALRKELAENTYITNEKLRSLINYSSSYGKLIVEMGGVAYKVDSNEIFEDGNYNPVLEYICKKSDLQVFHLPIGAVQIQSSREALNYTRFTKEALTKLFIQEFLTDAKKVIAA